MQQILTGPNLQLILNRKILISAGILLLCILAGWLGFRQILQPTAQPPAAAPISASLLEERYGLRINLVAVTAAGGFVDVRLTIIDAGKAKLLLQPAENYPGLRVAASGVTLSVPSDSRAAIPFQDGSGVFLLFPNSNNAVKRGSPVMLTFGKLQLEAIPAK
jgi:hypothetical protein